MAVIGNRPATNFQSIKKQTITGTGGSSYSLDHSVSNANDLEVFVNNVRQEPTIAYSATSQTITFSEGIDSTDDVYMIYQGQTVGTVAHPADQALSATTGTFSGALSGTTGTFTGDVSAPGHVIQVVQGVITANASITANSMTDTGISQAITPKSASSKVLVLINAALGISSTNGAEVHVQIVRGSTSIRLYERAIHHYIQSGGNNHGANSASFCFLDSPNTTSATTYKLQGRTDSGTLRINDYYSGNNNGASTITLMEIAQ